MERFPIPIKQALRWVALGLGVLAVVVAFGLVRDAQARFSPKTQIEGVELSGLTLDEAAAFLEAKNLVPPEHTVELATGEHIIASSSAELGAHYEHRDSLAQLLQKQQASFAPWLKQLLFPANLPQEFLPIAYDTAALTHMIISLKHAADAPAHPPAMTLTRSGVLSSLVIDRGKDAFEINAEETLATINNTLQATTAETIAAAENSTFRAPAVTTILSQQLTDEQVEAARARAAALVGEQLVFQRDHSRRTLYDTALIPLLQLPEGYQLTAINDTLQTWARDLNRSPQNAEFVYNPDTLSVTTFIPDRAGLMLDIPLVEQAIADGLKELEGTDTANLTDATITKDLALIETPADVTLAETNDLGINERIGFGESYYAHSIPTRVHNVALTASKINFTIIKPGAEFSFNKALGDVSAATGFRPAYVIKDGATVLGDGGGVCQVSSTLFRALLDSGLKITRRLPHSYRVSYYELNNKPGFDATVYAGEVDLRFVNDTDHAILLYTYTDSSSLYMFVELYGTSDGRTTEIVDYQSWDARPPLPTVYVPDASLAPGQLRQIDWSAPGLKTQFTHIIRDKDGNIMSQKDYYSNYRPWAARFLQGV